VKNKVAPPFRTVIVDMLFGEGISREGALIDMALERGLIKKSGAWFSYEDQRIGQGRDNTRKYLKDHPETYAAISKQLRDAFSTGGIAVERDPEAEEDDDEPLDDDE
jgi:recombination protein RecA